MTGGRRLRWLETSGIPKAELAVAQFLALCGLRGFWPMSAFGSGGTCYDQSGNGRTLTYNGNPVYGYDGQAPYIRFDGTGDYLGRADEAGLDITGTETYVLAGQRGLTLGGWFWPENAVSGQYLMSKWAGGGNLSYALILSGNVAGDPVAFYISDDGAGFDNVASVTGYTTSTWHWVVGRFNDADTGEELAAWLDNEKTTVTTARNAIFSGAAPFNISGFNNGSALYTGRASFCFLCAAALSDETISFLREQTKVMYGVS